MRVKLIFGFWKSSKTKIFKIIMGIGIVTMLIYSLFEISSSFIKCYIHLCLNGSPYDITVNEISQRKQEQIEKYCVKQNFESYLSYTEVGNAYLENGTEPFYIAGFRGDLGGLGEADLIQGRYPVEEGEICIENSANSILEEPYKIGDKISFTCLGDDGSETEIYATIVGLTEDYLFEGNFIFLDNDYAWRLKNNFSDSYVNTYIQICVRGYYDDKKVSDAYLFFVRTLGIDNSHIIWNQNKLDLYQDKENYYSISNAIKYLNVIVVFCAVLFIFGQFYNLYLCRMESYRVLRCIGYSSNRIALLLLEEAFLLSIPGLVIGFLSGNILDAQLVNNLVKLMVQRTSSVPLGQDIYNYIKSIGCVYGSVVIGIIIVRLLLGSLQPVKDLYNRKITLALSGKILKQKKELYRTPCIRRYVIRNSRLTNGYAIIQFIIILLSAMLCSIVFHVVSGYQSSQGNLDTKFPLQITAGASNSKTEFSKNDLNLIQNITGVTNICTEYVSNELYAVADSGKMPVVIYSDKLIDEIYPFLPENCLNNMGQLAVFIGTQKIDKEKVTILSSNYLRTKYPDIAESSPIILTGQLTEDINDITFNKDTSQSMVIINRNMAESIGLSGKLFNTICMDIQSDNDNVKKEIFDALGGREQFFVTDHMKESNAQNMLLGIIIMAGYILGLLFFTAIVIVSLAFQFNYYQKKQELDIMLAIGYTLGKVKWILSCSSCLLSIKAVVIGCLISIPINNFLLEAFYDTFYIRLELFFLVMAIFLLIGCVISVLLGKGKGYGQFYNQY